MRESFPPSPTSSDAWNRLTLGLDVTKRLARREAWRDPNNPFSKVQSYERKELDDEESGNRPRARTNQSDSAAFSHSRRKSPVVFAPQKANTSPISRTNAGGPSLPPNLPEDDSRREKSHDSGGDTSDTFSHDAEKEIEKEVEPEVQPERQMNGILGNSSSSVKPTLRQRITRFGGKNRNGKDKESRRESGFSIKKQKNHRWGTYPFTLWGQVKATLFNSWINVLLLAVPVGIALNYAKIDPVGIFVVNFIAIIPLAAMLSYATEEIAMHVGETLGGLLNASFGYAIYWSMPYIKSLIKS